MIARGIIGPVIDLHPSLCQALDALGKALLGNCFAFLLTEMAPLCVNHLEYSFIVLLGISIGIGEGDLELCELQNFRGC